MAPAFEKAWSDLNERLRQVETSKGLLAALAMLETHHRDSGFITDSLDGVERRTFHHPQEPGRFLRVQYNPRRALRFAGSGRAPAPANVANDGCFLCRENIRWQQQGTQIGYDIEIDDRTYFALMNPFPLLPAHVVIALSEHRTQDWKLADANGLDLGSLVNDLVRLADRMPGHIGFYNGVEAGASIPSHLHFQFVMRPADDPTFPLEAAARSVPAHDDAPGRVENYPLDAIVWRGEPDAVIRQASTWLAEWAGRNESRVATLSANIIATRSVKHGDVTLYFVPRDRGRSRSGHFSGLVGGLEVLGEIVLSNPDEKRRLDDGLINFSTIEAALSDVRVCADLG